MLEGMWLVTLAGVVGFLVVLYWVVRAAVADGIVAASRRLEGSDQDVARKHPTDLIDLGPEKPKQRPTGPSNY